MRVKEVVGKRIVKVNQTRFHPGTGYNTDVALDSIELDDGTVIYFQAVESESESYVVGFTKRRKKGSKSDERRLSPASTNELVGALKAVVKDCDTYGRPSETHRGDILRFRIIKETTMEQVKAALVGVEGGEE